MTDDEVTKDDRAAGWEPGCVKITLTWDECLQAAMYGAKRRFSAMEEKRGPPKFGMVQAGGCSWTGELEGAAGELAVAKHTGLRWHSFQRDLRLIPGDVGAVQVRQSAHPRSRLCIHDSDDRDAPFVLARGTFPTFYLMGWIYAGDAQKTKFWDASMIRPAYFVPVYALNKMTSLPLEKRLPPVA